MQEEEVPVWWWPVTTLAGSAGLIAVGTVIAWQELNAAWRTEREERRK